MVVLNIRIWTYSLKIESENLRSISIRNAIIKLWELEYFAFQELWLCLNLRHILLLFILYPVRSSAYQFCSILLLRHEMSLQHSIFEIFEIKFALWGLPLFRHWNVGMIFALNHTRHLFVFEAYSLVHILFLVWSSACKMLFNSVVRLREVANFWNYCCTDTLLVWKIFLYYTSTPIVLKLGCGYALSLFTWAERLVLFYSSRTRGSDLRVQSTQRRLLVLEGLRWSPFFEMTLW